MHLKRLSFGYADGYANLYVTDDQGNLVPVDQFFGELVVSIRVY